MKRLAHRWKTSPFARSVSALAGGAALGQGVVILASPFLTRLYTPADFGVLGVYAAVVGIVGAVAALRYDEALPLPAQDEDAAPLLWLALAAVALTSLLTGVVAWLLRGSALRWADGALEPYLWLIPIGVLLVGSYQALSYWAIRLRAFGRLARTKLAQGVAGVALQLGWGVWQGSAAGLIVGQIVGQSAGISTLTRTALRHSGAGLRTVTLPSLSQAARRYRRFPLLAAPAALLNAGGLQLPLLILAAIYGAGVVGYFALAQRILGLPVQLVGNAISQVYFGELSRLKHEPHQLSRVFRTTLQRSALLGLPLLGLALFMPPLFGVIFGAAWLEAGHYAQLLALMTYMRFVAMPIGPTLTVLERQDLHLLREAVRVALLSAAVALAGILRAEPRVAVLLISVAGVLSYIYYVSVSYRALNRNALEAGRG